MRSMILLLLFFTVYNSDAQTRFVEGIVIDSSSKEPLIYASVYHPQSKTHCYTDFDGKFRIELTGAEKTYIYIHYTGYECKMQAVEYSEQYLEIKLDVGQGIPPMRIIAYNNPGINSRSSLDSITQLCNRYQHEMDSVLTQKQQNKK